MSVNIKVKEFEETGNTPITILSKILLQANFATSRLQENNERISILKPYEVFLDLSSKLLGVAETFLDIITKGKDPVSAFSLMRIMADYLCSLVLIYENNDVDEISFRYFLYILDSQKLRFKNLKEIPEYDGRINRQEYDALCKQMIDARNNAKDAIQFCISQLDKHPYKNINEKLFQQIVKTTGGWKYKDFSTEMTISTKKVPLHSWRELYHFLDDREAISSFVSYCSQYVHGLGNTLLLTADEEFMYPITCLGIMLAGRYIRLIKNIYGEEYISSLIEDGCHEYAKELICFLKHFDNNNGLDNLYADEKP